MRMCDNKIAIFVPWVQLLCSEWQDHQGVEMKCFPERRRDQLGHQTWKIATDMFAHRFTYFWYCCFCCSSISCPKNHNWHCQSNSKCCCCILKSIRGPRTMAFMSLFSSLFTLKLGKSQRVGSWLLVTQQLIAFLPWIGWVFIPTGFLADCIYCAFLIGWMHFSPACRLGPSKLRDDATDWIHLQGQPVDAPKMHNFQLMMMGGKWLIDKYVGTDAYFYELAFFQICCQHLQKTGLLSIYKTGCTLH